MTVRRNAFTLMEVLLWIAMLAVMVSLVSVLFVSMTDGMRKGRRAAEEGETALTLAERLARDARAAGRVLPEADGRKAGPSCLILAITGGTVVYRAEGGGVFRDEMLVAGHTSVPLGKLAGVTFTPDAATPVKYVDVEIRLAHGARKLRVYLMNAEDAP